MKKILQINGHAIMNRGVEKYLLDIYREINQENMQIHFMTPLQCRNEYFRTVIDDMGGKIIELNGSENKVLNKLTSLKIYRYLRRHPYEIVHIHTGNVLLMGLFAMSAKLAGTKRVLVHAHNSADMSSGSSERNIKNKIADYLLYNFCDEFYACSNKAAKFMFPQEIYENQKYYVVPNGIQIEKYCFNEAQRVRIRAKYNIGNEVLLGCVGAFVPQKNHYFLCELMKELNQQGERKFILLLIGEGPLEAEIKKICTEYGILDSVIFAGTTSHVEHMLSAMDVLLMPSLYEGFPVVGVEAQASGLNCILSQNITDEIKLTEEMQMLPIDGHTDVILWADCIKNLSLNAAERRMQINRSMIHGAYHIQNSAKRFEEIYTSGIYI